MITEQLDSLVQPALNTVAPAISLVVYRNGKRLIGRGWGFINPKTEQHPTSADTLFDLASVTKLLTTTALLSCLDEQDLPLTTPLVEIVPEFANISPRTVDGGQDPHTRNMLPTPTDRQGMTVDPAEVTLWHLLTHTGGLVPWRDVFNIAPPPTSADSLTAHQRWEKGLVRLVEYSFVDGIGTNFHYSDIGMMLAGEALARLNSSSLAEAIQQRVLDPLGLENVMFNPLNKGIPRERIPPTEVDTLWRNTRVWGVVHDENSHGLGGVTGHAGLFGTAHDVARFGLAWLNRDELALSAEMHRQAIREQFARDGVRRGLGWMLNTHEGTSAGSHFSRAAYGHTGFTGTSLWVDPDQSLVVCLLTNRVYYGRQNATIDDFRSRVHNAIAQAI